MLVINNYMAIAIILALSCVTAETLLIIIFTKRFFDNNKPHSLLMLLIALVFLFIGDGLTVVGLFIPKTSIDLYIIIAKTSFVALILSAVSFLFFYEIFESDSLFGFKQLFITIIGTVTLASFFLHTQQAVYNASLDVHQLRVDPLTADLNKILPVLIGIVVILTAVKNYSLAWKKQQQQLVIMGIGAFIGYITPHIFIEPFQSSLVPTIGPGLFMVLTRLWVAVGFILYWYSFGSSKFFGFLQRQHAQELLMIAEGGIPLYSYNFRNNEKVLEDELLFGGAITAIGSLFKETLGKSNVKDITLDDNRKLLFKSFESYNLILITPKSSKYLYESLKRFGETIPRIIKSVDSISETNNLAQNGDRIVFESFGIPQA